MDLLVLWVLRGHLGRLGLRVKLVWWVVMGLLGWLALLGLVVLLAWLVRPGPPARPVPAVRLDSEDRKAYRVSAYQASREPWERLAQRVNQERWVNLDLPVYQGRLDPPDQSTPSSSVHLDSQGDRSC